MDFFSFRTVVDMISVLTYGCLFVTIDYSTCCYPFISLGVIFLLLSISVTLCSGAHVFGASSFRINQSWKCFRGELFFYCLYWRRGNFFACLLRVLILIVGFKCLDAVHFVPLIFFYLWCCIEGFHSFLILFAWRKSLKEGKKVVFDVSVVNF